LTDLTGSDKFFTNIKTDAEMWESLIDQAIDKINGYGALFDLNIPNMAGTAAGSKSVSVSSAEAGFIRDLAVALYQKNVVSQGAQSSSYQLQGISSSQSASSSSGGEIEALAKEAAERLRDLDVTVGADASF